MKTAGIAYIGVGSNIDPYENCAKAVRRLRQHPHICLLGLSSLFRTSPVSPVPQDDFLNCALKVQWEGSPLDLLALLLCVEKEQGRKRDIPLGPRTLDLDILLFDDLILETPELVIPHPRLHERRFALVPCLEIDPDLVHPLFGVPLSQFLEEIGDGQRLEVFGRLQEEEILRGRQNGRGASSTGT
ncbi:MAG TPA: 2-amino-4-hydroxy-6-hydroxymethyldihydropteridine diphosphokinase [Syntrophorhabdales bacterium]|nr:2-amino-4-hydroxy-6-hydroxymethyldihydropteridine diphosphokinase [Syntrophorhabdales bacterium]